MEYRIQTLDGFIARYAEGMKAKYDAVQRENKYREDYEEDELPPNPARLTAQTYHFSVNNKPTALESVALFEHEMLVPPEIADLVADLLNIALVAVEYGQPMERL